MPSWDIKSNFSIYDSEDSLNLLRDISGKDNIDIAEQLQAQQWQISSWKSASIAPDQAL